MDLRTNFAKWGIWLGVILIALEYFLSLFLFSYANPDAMGYGYPHKFLFYTFFLTASAILGIVLFRPALRDEIAEHAGRFDNFYENIVWMIGLSAFWHGTDIIYHIVKGNVMDEVVITWFVDNNLLVESASEPFSILNIFVYPAVIGFIYQGFLLAGVSKEAGFLKASIITSLFYGYLTGNMVGGAMMNIFLNEVYRESKNIFYPIVLSVIIDLIFTAAFIISPEAWVLKANHPDYNDELVKGIVMTIIGMPIVISLIKRIFQRGPETANHEK